VNSLRNVDNNQNNEESIARRRRTQRFGALSVTRVINDLAARYQRVAGVAQWSSYGWWVSLSINPLLPIDQPVCLCRL